MVQAHRTARARSALGQLGQQQVNRPEVYSTLLVDIVEIVALVYIKLYLLLNIYILFGLRQMCQGITSSRHTLVSFFATAPG
jgi:hypothetical protein